MAHTKDGMDSSLLTIDEIKAHLRKDYPWWKCPKKSDRLLITEEQWAQIDWTEEETFRNAPLPHKMWNMRHDDHFWPRCHNWRGDDAYGYRAPEGHPRRMPKLPKLVVGRGIARWMADGDASVAEVPEFAGYHTEITDRHMPAQIEFVERKCGHPEYGKIKKMSTPEFLEIYAPSALQKFSERSWLKREPYHISHHYIIEKNEDYCSRENGPDLVWLSRYGWRWDSFDGYFRKRAIYTGLRWN